MPLLALVTLAAWASTPSADARQLIAELNLARTRPAAYAERLQAYAAGFDGAVAHEQPGDLGRQTFEGPRAVDEAMSFVLRQKPTQPLIFDPALSRSAAALAEDQARTGRIGHTDSNGAGPQQRIALYAPGAINTAEIVSYGHPSAEGVVRQFVVDDGERGRLHRGDVFDPLFHRVGVACDEHPTWGVVCVVELAP